MAFRPEEVSSILQKEIEKYQTKLEMESVGTILQVGDGIDLAAWATQRLMAREAPNPQPRLVKSGNGSASCHLDLGANRS